MAAISDASGLWRGDLSDGQRCDHGASGVLRAIRRLPTRRGWRTRAAPPEELRPPRTACFSMAFANYLSTRASAAAD
jgi:hypothetical protein